MIRVCALLFGAGKTITKVENKLGDETYKKRPNDVKFLNITVVNTLEKIVKEGIFVIKLYWIPIL